MISKSPAPAFANPGDIDTHDAFFEVVGDVSEKRLRAVLTPNLEFRIWNDARVGDAVVQVRASGACALARVRPARERRFGCARWALRSRGLMPSISVLDGRHVNFLDSGELRLSVISIHLEAKWMCPSFDGQNR